MNKKPAKEPLSKRQALREAHIKKQRQQRILMIGGVILFAVFFIGLIIISNQKTASVPAGSFVTVTPSNWPNPKDTALGNPNAKARIDIYEDFQCSACAAYTQSIEPQVIKDLVATGKAYYVFHNYPFLDDQLPYKDSDQAANAALCAAEQGRFWDFHAILFANSTEQSGEFSDSRLMAFAQSIGLDMNSYNTCYKARKYQSKIDVDVAAGLQLKIQGTPSVFINGVYITPGNVPSFLDIQKAVEAAQ
jgi:protein-disulfide isomerase